MAHLRTQDALGEAPVALFTELTSLHTLILQNPSATDVVYFKIYVQDDSPTMATDVPTFEIPVPAAGVYPHPLLNAVIPKCWMAATASSGADDTAPDADLHVTLTYNRL